MEFEELIKKNKPKLSPNSLKTYLDAIKIISKSVKLPIETVDDLVSHKDIIIKYLLRLKLSDRKKKLSAIINVLVGENSKQIKDVVTEYRTQLYADIVENNEISGDQLLTDAQEGHLPLWEDVLKIRDELKAEAEPLWKKDTLSPRQFQTLQDYVIMSLYTFIPPRRSLDYCSLKLKNFDDVTIKSEDNYLVIPKNKSKLSYIVFNKYKNKSRLGSQQVEIPNILKKLLLKWNEKNPHNHCIVNSKGNPINQQFLVKILNRIFGDTVSCNLLRHSFITSLEPELRSDIKQMKGIAYKMGNDGLESILKYFVKDVAKSI